MVRLKDILDTKLLAKHLEEGVVSVQRHPDYPLAIFNYTHKAQHDNIWDDVTKTCRGLIVNLNNDGIVARPFRKFFNLNTSFAPETMEATLPAASGMEVTEKLDGSLGILYNYGGMWGIATRGSFTSDQARWGTQWFRDHYAHTSSMARLWTGGQTALFEIIYPDNRIVVNYDFQGLVLLGFVDTMTGVEHGHSTLMGYENYGVRVVRRFNKSLAQCMRENIEGTKAEGYVLFWPGRPLRVKVKFADYVRLHRLITGVNPIAIWEILLDGGNVDALISDPQLPEDFKQWVREWKAKILLDFQSEVRIIDALLAKLPCQWDPADNKARGRIAAHLAHQAQIAGLGATYAGLAISKLNNKPRIVNGQETHLKTWEYAVWQRVRPEYSKAYKKVEEGS